MKNYFEAELKDKRLSCPCGCGAKISDDTLKKLNMARECFGKPIYIEQGATCLDYSVNKVGRKPTSTHIDNGIGALGIDINSKTFKTKEDFYNLLSCFVQNGFSGVGIGSYWIGKGSDRRFHIDTKRGVGGDFRTWTYGV
jgi:hypothetical protein